MSTLNKPWIMYESEKEIGEAIQLGLTERLQFPVGIAFREGEFLIIIKLPGNDAHIRFKLEDLKGLYPHVEAFVSFLEESWNESVSKATPTKKK